MFDMLNQWFVTFNKHAESLGNFPSFCRIPFLPMPSIIPGVLGTSAIRSQQRSEMNYCNDIQRWPWLACCHITTLLVMFQMIFIEPLKRLHRTLGFRSNPA